MGILTTIGGANSADMLPLLDVPTLKRNPKVLIGFSDTTSLLLGVQALAGWVTFYGPAVMTQFGEYPGPLDYTLESFRNFVFAEPQFEPEIQSPSKWTNELLAGGALQGLRQPPPCGRVVRGKGLPRGRADPLTANQHGSGLRLKRQCWQASNY
jgi:muramoyltetrapeptide carboxypeptidase